MSLTFQGPTGGEFLDAKTIVGHLIFIPKVTKVFEMTDKFNGGTKPAAKVVAVDLDGDAEAHERTLTARWLVEELSLATKNFLGRVVTRDTGKAQPAYVWEPADEADQARAIEWIDAHRKSALQTPAPAPKAAPAPAVQSTGVDDLDDILADLEPMRESNAPGGSDDVAAGVKVWRRRHPHVHRHAPIAVHNIWRHH